MRPGGFRLVGGFRLTGAVSGRRFQDGGVTGCQRRQLATDCQKRSKRFFKKYL